MRVDVVISDAAARDSTRTLLDVYDYAGRAFSRASDYMDAAGPPPDCLITDRLLSDMSGVEFLERLRARGETTPVLVTVGRVDEPLAAGTSRLAAGLIEKPFAPDRLLLSILRRCFEPSRRRGRRAVGRRPGAAAPTDQPRAGGQEWLAGWETEAATGISLIDVEHERIRQDAAGLLGAVLSDRPAAELRDAFQRLLAASEAHFLHEEEYARSSGFPGIEGHGADHRRLLEALRKFGDATEVLGPDRSSVAADIGRFLDGWLMNHIVTDDRRLAAHLLGRGAG